MTPFRGAVGACALWLLAAGVTPTQAAWNNVFQVCCDSCGGQPAVSAYAPDPCCNPCPQPVCTTRYVARCYYQPVTSYQSKSYYEPVTTYRTSYYYEPVTSYRYSCYYDPCSCSYKQVACPTTCYQLRSQCCPVQSWVQRCCQVPVTTYQQSFYYEPVTTCCTPACPSPCATAAAPPPPAAQPPAVAAPGVYEQRSTPAVPNVIENRGPSTDGTGFSRQLQPRAPLTPPAAPTVKLDKIVSASGNGVEGQVVGGNQVPHAGAKVSFVSLDHKGGRQAVVADASGQFRVALASGGWLVYVDGSDGKPVFHRKIEVKADQASQVTLVSR